MKIKIPEDKNASENEVTSPSNQNSDRAMVYNRDHSKGMTHQNLITTIQQDYDINTRRSNQQFASLVSPGNVNINMNSRETIQESQDEAAVEQLFKDILD